MRNTVLLILGVVACIAIPYVGLIQMANVQLGGLKPFEVDEGEQPYPRQPVGIAKQGEQVYRQLGCVACHTQQVRRKGYGSDFERQWGMRQTVPRDYIWQQELLLGSQRTGPDLRNVGERESVAMWHFLLLFDPEIHQPGSKMPSFKYLFEKRKINNGTSSEFALQFPEGYKYAPGADYEIVPTKRAEYLVAYLLSLKLDYELPEAPFQEPDEEDDTQDAQA